MAIASVNISCLHFVCAYCCCGCRQPRHQYYWIRVGSLTAVIARNTTVRFHQQNMKNAWNKILNRAIKPPMWSNSLKIQTRNHIVFAEICRPTKCVRLELYYPCCWLHVRFYYQFHLWTSSNTTKPLAVAGWYSVHTCGTQNRQNFCYRSYHKDVRGQVKATPTPSYKRRFARAITKKNNNVKLTLYTLHSDSRLQNIETIGRVSVKYNKATS